MALTRFLVPRPRAGPAQVQSSISAAANAFGVGREVSWMRGMVCVDAQPTKRYMRNPIQTSFILIWLLSGFFLPAPIAAATPSLEWDRSTLQLIQRGGNYARMARVRDGLLCCFEIRGKCFVRHSIDEGVTWQVAVEAGEFEFGSAANPELLCCKEGKVLLFYNQR